MSALIVDEAMLQEPNLLSPRLAPQWPVKINWNHPLSRALAFCVVGGQPNELVTGIMPDTRAATLVGTANGKAWRTDDSGFNCLIWNREFVKTSSGTGTGDYTFLAYCNPLSRDNIDNLLCQKYDAIGAPYTQSCLLANADSAANLVEAGAMCFFTYELGIVSGHGTSIIDGSLSVYAGRRLDQAYTVWKNGVNRTQTSGTSLQDISDGQRRMGIGYSGKSDNVEGADADFLLTCAWNRGLSDAEMMEMSNRPFQFLIPA